MTPDSSLPPSSPWRQPIVWLVAALPLASVIAAVSLLVVAARSSGNNDLVVDPGQRTAQVQVADLDPDARAQQLALSAVLRIAPDHVEVLPVTGAFDREHGLSLRLSHPGRAALDRRLALVPSPTGWQAIGAVQADHDWIVQLSSTEARWRLRGRVAAGQQAAHLAPALSAR